MKITDHDEFLHLAYPKNTKDPWKENYYFNYIDREANAMGIFHCSYMRWQNKVRVITHQLIDGKQYSYIKFHPLPLNNSELLDESIIMKDDYYSFEILDPHAKHRLRYCDKQLDIDLIFSKRFDVFNFDEAVSNEGDRGFDVEHYEQGMNVMGTIIVDGKVKQVSCLGHRDHTWGYRDESGLAGWHWVAVLGQESSWNITRVKRVNHKDDQTGFISDAEGSYLITGVEVLGIERNSEGEPIITRYKVTLENGDVRHVTASRFARLEVGGAEAKVEFYENFCEFIVEETGETAVGVDEHMVVPGL